MTEGITIIIPTLNGGETFQRCLRAIREQRSGPAPQLIVIDSGSSDGTVETAERERARVIRVRPGDFHHGRTRNEALQHAAHDRVIFLVQDAIPASRDWLGIMSSSLDEDDVAAAYGKHLPHDNADLFAWFETTSLNEFLGDRVLIQELDADSGLLRMPYERAVRLTRCDNVCAIYKRRQLQEIPFPDVVFGEDMAWAGEALSRGLKIKYDPAIRVRHSHNRGPDYRFRRALTANFITAEILGRVRQDLSFLTVRDLDRAGEILKTKQARIAARITGKDDARRIPLPKLWSKLDRIPGLPYALARTFRRLSVIGGRKQWLFNFSRGAEAQLYFMLNKVTGAFPRATGEELLSCTGQMVGSIKGTLYGEVAASYQKQGSLPPELSEIIRPVLDRL